MSPFERAFDHYDRCSECSYAERRLCAQGRALFEVAHETCKRLVVMPEPSETKN